LGFEVAMSVVKLDQREMAQGGDLYFVGGGGKTPKKFGLGKASLNQLCTALGIDWDLSQTGRLDDGSDPRYCHYRAVGTIKGLDGTPQTLSGEKEMDLRDGSPQVEALHERKRGGGDASNQIREMRLHILSHAETKSKLRAIRSVGIRTSYTEADLRKPFVIAKLMFTGRVPGNPELESRFAEMQAAQVLGGPRALYGAGLQAPIAPKLQAPAKHPPPPIGVVGAGDDDHFSDYVEHQEVIDAPPELPRTRTEPSGRQANAARQQAPQDPQSAPTQQRLPQDSQGPTGISEDLSGIVIPGGQEKGTPIEHASDGTLKYWHNRLAANLNKGDVEDRFIERDSLARDAMADEIAARASRSGKQSTQREMGDDSTDF
jgi:hypothetical protein